MSVMCRLYGVTRAGYYAWKGRGESARAKADGRLWVHIERIYQASGGTYGSPRIHAALKGKAAGSGRNVWSGACGTRPEGTFGKTLSCQSGEPCVLR